MLKKYGSSMFTAPQIPVAMRMLIPIIIIINILLFISGHLSLGAAVKLALDLMGESTCRWILYLFNGEKYRVFMCSSVSAKILIISLKQVSL